MVSVSMKQLREHQNRKRKLVERGLFRVGWARDRFGGEDRTPMLIAMDKSSVPENDGVVHAVLLPLSSASHQSRSSTKLVSGLSAQETHVTTPPQQLAFTDLPPLSDSVWSYLLFLYFTLALWIVYLALPLGFRRHFCGAQRRRYLRRTDDMLPVSGYWLPASKPTLSQTNAEVTSSWHKMEEMQRNQKESWLVQQRSGDLSSKFSASAASSETPGHSRQSRHSTLSSLAGPSVDNLTEEATDDFSRSYFSVPPRRDEPVTPETPPSPDHPAIAHIPSEKILSETMSRLQGRGIRLIAHGVQSEPKRVWIRLEDSDVDTTPTAVSWQTEFPRRVPNSSGETTIVLMRGSLHRISLINVLYIDVGKKTNALRRPANRNVPDAHCWSLLTQNGSLDLQTHSKLERDSLVSCFSMILDDVHGPNDWRALYEASPEPSVVSSAYLQANEASTMGTTITSNFTAGGNVSMSTGSATNPTSAQYGDFGSHLSFRTGTTESTGTGGIIPEESESEFESSERSNEI